MADSLDVELNVDFSAAVAGVRDLSADVETGLAEAAATGADAISTALADIAPLNVEADTADAQTAIGELGTEPVALEVDAETSGAEAAIEGISAEPVSLEVDADTGPAEASIDEVVALAESTDLPPLELDVDTGNAEQQLDDLSGGLEQTSGAAEGASASLGQTALDVGALKGISGLAKGEVAGVGSALGGISGGAALAVGGVGAVVAILAELEQAGLKSVAADERLNVVFGDLDESVKHIDVGGLNGDLGELAIKSGSSGAALKQAAAAMGQLAISSGTSNTEARDFAQTITALSLRAVALNPKLGEAGDIAGKLGLALSRGGRFAGNFGISLTAAEITARALADTGKATASDLTLYEKAAAGATLATDHLGASIGTDFARGADQAAVKTKALEKALGAAFAGAGRGLVDPTIAALSQLEPVFTDVSAGLGVMADAVASATTSLEPLIGGVVSILGPFLKLSAVMNPVVIGILSVSKALEAIATPLDVVGSNLTEAGGHIAEFFGNAKDEIVDFISAGDNLPSQQELVKTSTEAATAALFGQSTTLKGLADDTAHLNENFADFIKTSSLFKSSNQLDDLRRAGISMRELNDELASGDVGLTELRDALAASGEAFVKFNGGTASIAQLRQAFKETGGDLDSFHGGIVLANLGITDLSAKNTELIRNLIATSDALDKAAKNTAKELVANGELSQGTLDLALAQSKAETGARSYSVALDIIGDSTTRLLPFLTATEQATERSKKAFSDFTDELESKKGDFIDQSAIFGKSIEDVGSLQKAYEDAVAAFDAGTGSIDDVNAAFTRFQDAINPETVKAKFEETANSQKKFFDDVLRIFDEGSPRLATALAKLGPENAGAVAEASLAANDPSVRAGFEEMFRSADEIETRLALAVLKATDKAKLIFGLEGTAMGEALATAFGVSSVDDLAGIAQEKIEFAKSAIETQIKPFAAVFETMGLSSKAAYNLAFEIVTGTTAEVSGAEDVVDGSKLPEKTGDKADAASKSYKDLLDLKKPTKDQVGDAEGAIDGSDAPGKAGLKATGVSDFWTGGLHMGDRTLGDVHAAEGALDGTDAPGIAGRKATAISDFWGGGLHLPAATGGSLQGVRDLFGNGDDYGSGAGGEHVGSEFVGGAIRGLFGRKQELHDAAGEVADEATIGAKAKLGIVSPSKVAMQIGGYFGEGLAIGIEKSVDRVAKATGVLAGEAGGMTLPSLDATMARLSATVPGSTAGNTVQIAEGAVVVHLTPPAGATAAQVGSMAREAVRAGAAELAEFRAVVAAIGTG